jgi:hypothetical protein
MGMDVYGREPSGQCGEYFRNNVYRWHPLADYCRRVAPDICAACKSWHTNDWDGLDGAHAAALAEALQREIDSGRTQSYARRYAAEQELMPNELCNSCGGNGVQKPIPARIAAEIPFPTDVKGGGDCYRCGGAGYVRPWETENEFRTENVAAFAAFLRESGGFTIQ